MKLLAVAIAGLMLSAGGRAADQSGGKDLTEIRSWIQAKDPALTWLGVMRRQALESGRIAVVVSAAPLVREEGLATPVRAREGHTGIFVVSASTSRIERILDFRPSGALGDLGPVIESAPGVLYLHYFSDYGFYGGSVKYLYSVDGTEEVKRLPYSRLAFRTRLAAEEGRLRYAAEDALQPASEGAQSLSLSVAIRAGAGFPATSISIEAGPQTKGATTNMEGVPTHVMAALPRSAQWNIGNNPNPRLLPLSRSRWVYLEAGTTPYGEQLSGALVIGPGGSTDTEMYPVPVPALESYTNARQGRVKQMRGHPPVLNNTIGPAALEGETLWFASHFYDGEGMSGVGAIGSLDVRSGEYRMRHFSEIADWSGSAILLDGEEVWAGLQRNPEGASYGGGLLRYNRVSGEAKVYPVTDLIHTLDKLGEFIFAGTEHGLYQLEPSTGRLAHVRVEPDESGKLTVVTR